MLFGLSLFFTILTGEQWAFQPGKPFSSALGHFLELILGAHVVVVSRAAGPESPQCRVWTGRVMGQS